MADVLPDDVSVVFHIEGEGGGVWEVVARPGHPAVIQPPGEGPKDCQVWCEAEVFMAILGGTLNARQAFLAGQIRASGDIGLALRLQQALGRSR